MAAGKTHSLHRPSPEGRHSRRFSTSHSFRSSSPQPLNPVRRFKRFAQNDATVTMTVVNTIVVTAENSAPAPPGTTTAHDTTLTSSTKVVTTSTVPPMPTSSSTTASTHALISLLPNSSTVSTVNSSQSISTSLATSTSSDVDGLSSTSSLGPSSSSSAASASSLTSSVMSPSNVMTSPLPPSSSSAPSASSASALPDSTPLPAHEPSSRGDRGPYIIVASLACFALLLIVILLATRIVNRRNSRRRAEAAQLQPDPYTTRAPALAHRFEKPTFSIYTLSDFDAPSEVYSRTTPTPRTALVIPDTMSINQGADSPSSSSHSLVPLLDSGVITATQPQVNPVAGRRNTLLATRTLSVQHQDGGISLDRGAGVAVELPPVYRRYH